MDPQYPDGKDPFLPPMIKVKDFLAPQAPHSLEVVPDEKEPLFDMGVKLAATVARFNTDWASKQLKLSMPMTRDLLGSLAQEGLLEELWQSGEGNSFYRISEQGKQLQSRLVDVCAYVGPAPISLDAYCSMLRWQFHNTPPVKPHHVAQSLNQLVLPNKAAQLAGLAVSSGRSLFIYGPPGNGKSSVGRAIQQALPGDYWIPYAINVGTSIIRVYDSHAHQKVEMDGKEFAEVDHRWVRIRRPMVVVGGELTLDMLDLIYSPSLKLYEAPPHLKANGGVFLVDDFGRERISPEELLNRFITPMEHWVDYFTLKTGQKIQLPLRNVMIFATNLSPDKVTDPAFLRRMGYRMYLGSPTPEQYTTIFHKYAEKMGTTASPETIERILARYAEQGRELRACEPRDLIERSSDICKFHNRPLELSNKVIDLAWTGYFGENLPVMNTETSAKAPKMMEVMGSGE